MNELATIEEPRAVALHEPPPASDLRHKMMTLAVDDQNRVLAEYVDRRNNFRRWLREQFEEGLHYGFPPGCEPKQTNPRQWQAKPSLYAAGADLLCDLLAVRCEYSADIEAWQQLGSKPGHFVVACRLYSRATNQLVGEGRGVRREGQKGGDANNALKMAQKSAKVDAVLNTYGLRDLYGQDLDVPVQPPHDNPDENADAPKAEPRAKREQAVTREQCGALLAAWKQLPGNQSEPSGDVAKWHARFFDWARQTAGRDFDPSKAANWTAEDYRRVDTALAALEGK